MDGGSAANLVAVLAYFTLPEGGEVINLPRNMTKSHEWITVVFASFDQLSVDLGRAAFNLSAAHRWSSSRKATRWPYTRSPIQACQIGGCLSPSCALPDPKLQL